MKQKDPEAVPQESTPAENELEQQGTDKAADDAQAPEAARREGLGPPAVLVVGHVVDLRPLLRWVEKKPLFGVRVAVTRPREQNETLARALANAGADVSTTPTIKIAPRERAAAIELATTKLASEMKDDAASKDAEITELKERLRASEVAQKLAVTEAISPKDIEIQNLKSKLASLEVSQKLAITEAVNVVEKERDELKNELQCKELEKELAEKSLKEKYETQIKDRDHAIEGDLAHARDPGWQQLDEHHDEPRAEQQSCDAARGSEHQALRQQLADEPRLACAQRSTDRELSPSPGRPGEQKARDVRAGDQQDQTDRTL